MLPENGPKKLEETVYTFDYQGTRFIPLNSQAALIDSTVLGEQAKIKNKKGQNTLVDQAPVLAPERLNLPAEYQKRFNS